MKRHVSSLIRPVAFITWSPNLEAPKGRWLGSASGPSPVSPSCQSRDPQLSQMNGRHGKDRHKRPRTQEQHLLTFKGLTIPHLDEAQPTISKSALRGIVQQSHAKECDDALQASSNSLSDEKLMAPATNQMLRCHHQKVVPLDGLHCPVNRANGIKCQSRYRKRNIRTKSQLSLFFIL